MNRTLTLSLFTCLVLVSGCGESHTPGADGGGGSRRDAGGSDAGAFVDGGSSRRDGGGIMVSDGGVIVRPGDAGGPPLDILGRCIEACEHLASCSPEFDRLECIDDCLGTRDSIPNAACENLLLEVFECVDSLSCRVIRRSPELRGTECGGLLERFEAECSDAPTRTTPPMPGA